MLGGLYVWPYVCKEYTRNLTMLIKFDAGGSVAGSSAGGGDAGQAPIVVEPIVRELSQLFTNKDSSWGFEKMFDMGKLYNPREGYMTQFGTKPEDVQMGEITMVVSATRA